jgi:hypothetical protein
MTTKDYNSLVKALKQIRVKMIESGIGKNNIDLVVFDLHVAMTDKDDNAIIKQITKSFLTICENAEEYELCAEIQKIKLEIEELENDQ